MCRHILDPVGDLVAVAAINSVHLAEGKGVAGLDMRRRLAIWIDEKDPEKAKKARDLLIALVQSKGRTGQPDWSFLKKTTTKAST